MWFVEKKTNFANSLYFSNPYMFGLGTGEIILILLVILVFFGAKGIPELAKGLGKGIREFKDASQGIQNSVRKEIEADVENTKQIEAESEKKNGDIKPWKQPKTSLN